MRFIPFLIAAIPIVAQSPTKADLSNRQALVGTWKIVSVASIDSEGHRKEDEWGRDPRASIVYTPEGWMSAVITYGGRKPLSVPDRFQAPAAEKATAFETSFSYAGRYEVKGDKVIHHVEMASVENWVNTDLIRTFRLNGDQLVLTTPPLPTRQGRTATVELTWARRR